jgi:hypothetical protein
VSEIAKDDVCPQEMETILTLPMTADTLAIIIINKIARSKGQIKFSLLCVYPVKYNHLRGTG